MSTANNLYVGCFYDANPSSTDGFDAIIGHANKTLELTTTIINLLEARFTAEDVYVKNCVKSLKPYMKSEGLSATLIPIITSTFDYENKIREKMCTDINALYFEPFKQEVRKQSDILKKAKSDCIIVLKTRKSTYDVAMKACKMYTLKYRSHDQFVKKFADQQDLDDKTKNRILKSQQSVQLAEKDAEVSAQMLQRSLFEYELSLEKLCEKVELFDVALIAGCAEILNKLYETHSISMENIETTFTKFKTLPSYTSAQSYCSDFVEQNKMPNILLKYAGVSEILEEDRLEFKLNLSAEPLESKFNLSLSSNFDNHISKLCNNSAEISLHSNEINREASPSSCRNPPSNVGKRVVALYSFAAENPDELSFNEGDTIEIVKQAEDEWYVGLLGDGSKGLFPINYVGPFSP